MWSDNEADIDLLQFGYLVSAVTDLVRARHLLPISIGLFGDWGSGKSTLLKLVQDDLEQDDGVLCLTFNGWLFEGFEDAKTALMGTIIESIQDRIDHQSSPPEKAKKLAAKLLRRVNWMRVAKYALPALAGLPQISLANLGVDAWKALQGLPDMLTDKAKNLDPDEVAKFFKDAPEGEDNARRNIREFRSDFDELVQLAKIETLVVFIDDLDRCLPDTIIEILEAIKLFLFVRGSAFIIGADPRLVEYAVRRRFPEVPGTETFEVGRDYLEKLVQIPIKVPPLNSSEISSYMSLLFAEERLTADYDPIYAKICEYASGAAAQDITQSAFDIETARSLAGHTAVWPQLESDLGLVAQIVPVLAPGLGGSPRRSKRFLNTLLLRMSMAEDRNLNIERKVLAKLMLLEYLKPEFFKQLARLQSTQTGRPKELATAEIFMGRATSEASDNARVEQAEKVQNQFEERTRTDGSTGSQRGKSNNVEPLPIAQRQNATSPPSKEDLPEEIQPWLVDGWMLGWLRSDPQLRGSDLRPYFYVAHDKLGVTTGPQLPLSLMARDALNKMLQHGPATRLAGLRQADALNDPDITALFAALADRIKQAEALDESSPQDVVFKLVGRRKELLPQLVTLYSQLPENKLTMEVPTLIFTAVDGTASMAAGMKLLERWTRSPIDRLAKAAKLVLSRRQRS